MSNKKYNTVVFITNAQPVSQAHVQIIHQSLEISEQVIVVVGSINRPRTFENPFTYDERKSMLIKSVPKESVDTSKFIVVGVEDSLYNRQAWATRVQELVKKSINPKSQDIALIKCDDSKLFPQWDELDFGWISEDITSEGLRKIFFENWFNMSDLDNIRIPDSTYYFLKDFDTYRYETKQTIIDERLFIEDYKKQYDVLKWPVTFVTVDAVVVQSGHVLLIQRKAIPGRGTLALPGGFFDAENDVSIVDATLRELREETRLKVPERVLRGSICRREVYDAINRSSRGRTITHAALIVLEDGPLPHVKGSDDAEKARWVPLSNINPSMMFEDHYHIIQDMVGNI